MLLIPMPSRGDFAYSSPPAHFMLFTHWTVPGVAQIKSNCPLYTTTFTVVLFKTSSTIATTGFMKSPASVSNTAPDWEPHTTLLGRASAKWTGPRIKAVNLSGSSSSLSSTALSRFRFTIMSNATVRGLKRRYFAFVSELLKSVSYSTL